MLFVVTVTGALLLTGCSGAGGDTKSSAPADAETAVVLNHPTEDGLKISFDKTPETLVMDCYAYSSLREYGLEPDALFGFDCDNPFVMGDMDISGIQRIGTAGEIDMEKLAQLQPDAVIGQGTATGWAWFDEDVNAQLTKVAPFIPLPRPETVDEGISATREVGEFLGGDVDSQRITDSDKAYARAKEDFKAAAEQKDLNFMFASPTKEMLYTGVGFPAADLVVELGATVVGAPPPEKGNPWGQVAWEEAATYPADVILVEGYSDDYTFDSEMWDSLPAVEADQLGSWGSKGALTAQNYADWLQNLVTLVDSAEKLS